MELTGIYALVGLALHAHLLFHHTKLWDANLNWTPDFILKQTWWVSSKRVVYGVQHLFSYIKLFDWVYSYQIYRLPPWQISHNSDVTSYLRNPVEFWISKINIKVNKKCVLNNKNEKYNNIFYKNGHMLYVRLLMKYLVVWCFYYRYNV